MNSALWRQRLLFLSKLGLATALLAWLAFSGRLQLDGLASVRLSLDWGFLTALTLGAALLPTVRWWWLLRIQHLGDSFWRVLVLNWTGFFVGLILPGAASGDVAKGYLILRRQPRARARAVSTVLADRFLGLYSLLFLGSVTVAWLAFQPVAQRSVQAMTVAIVGIFLGMTCAAACLLFAGTRKVLLRVLPSSWREAWSQSFELYRVSRWSLSGCFLLSLASSAMTFASFVVAGRMIGEDVSLLASFAAGPLIVLANCLPVTPGGLGAGEAASSELLACFGSQHGAEVMILVRIVGLIIFVPGIAGLWSLPTPTGHDHPVNRKVALPQTPRTENPLTRVHLRFPQKCEE